LFVFYATFKWVVRPNKTERKYLRFSPGKKQSSLIYLIYLINWMIFEKYIQIEIFFFFDVMEEKFSITLFIKQGK
jgi:hypothetical protein